MSIIITCILLAMVLFFFEIFVPGGILGILGGISLLAAVYFTYTEFGLFSAILAFILSCLLAIAFFFLEMAILSKTRLGRKFLLNQTQEGNIGNVAPADSDIIGQTGITLTKMVPSGRVRIGGKDYEAFSQDGHLDKGELIEAISKDAFRIIVKKQSN